MGQSLIGDGPFVDTDSLCWHLQETAENPSKYVVFSFDRSLLLPCKGPLPMKGLSLAEGWGLHWHGTSLVIHINLPLKLITISDPMCTDVNVVLDTSDLVNFSTLEIPANIPPNRHWREKNLHRDFVFLNTEVIKILCRAKAHKESFTVFQPLLKELVEICLEKY